MYTTFECVSFLLKFLYAHVEISFTFEFYYFIFRYLISFSSSVKEFHWTCCYSQTFVIIESNYFFSLSSISMLNFAWFYIFKNFDSWTIDWWRFYCTLFVLFNFFLCFPWSSFWFLFSFLLYCWNLSLLCLYFIFYSIF